ncbi:MAG: NAD(P)/FAD-dependent oxidoreductase [Armatimonadota bacterium]
MTDSADVVIIGGGLIGCACAYYLTTAGLSVVLCERGDLGEGASGACEGILSLQSKPPGPALRAARRALDLYQTLPGELDADLELRREGGLVVCQTDQDLELARAQARRLADEGVPVELLSPAQARGLVPALVETIAGAAYCPLEAHLNPWKLLLALARVAERGGARLLTHTTVEGIRCRGDVVEGVDTSAGAIHCRAVVNATGARAPEVAAWVGVALDIAPQRGQVLVTEKAPKLLGPFVLSAGYAAGKLRSQAQPPAAVAAAQLATGNVLIGSTRELVGDRADTTPEGLTDIATEAQALLPGLAGLAVIRSFAGVRPYTPAGRPVVGHVGGPAGFIVAAGHGGDGVALAPWTGAQVAQVLTDGSTLKKQAF